MKYLFSILLILSFLPTNVFAESERPQAIVIPISSMGAVTKSQKQILQNTLEDNLKSYFTLISQELFEKAQEKAFEELDYEECTEDQCIMLIQEMLQVENAFHLQVIREGQNTQLSLSWRTLDEKKKETDVCMNCETFEINDRIEKLILLITGKTKETQTVVISDSKVIDSLIRVDLPVTLFSQSKNITESEDIGTSDIQNYSFSYYFKKTYGIGMSSIKIKSNRYICISSPGCNLRKYVREHTILFVDLSYIFRLNNFNFEIGYPYPYFSKESDFDEKQVDISSGFFSKIGYEVFDTYDVYFHLRSFSTKKIDTSNPKQTDIMFGTIGVGYYF